MPRTHSPHEHVSPTDTAPEAARLQERIFREMGPAGRDLLANELSEAVIEETRRALARKRPGSSEQEIDIAFVERCYGTDLARAFEEHLRRR